MEQTHRLYGRAIRILTGYRGQRMSGHTKIMIPGVPKATDSTYMKARKHELFRKRAGIEPVIGHCKS
ncbi:MAG: IS5/IS1182 family transposase, partial [Bacteroidaceae bacterium]